MNGRHRPTSELCVAVITLVVLTVITRSDAEEGIISKFPVGTRIQRDVVYVRRENDRGLKLDLYVPPGEAPPPARHLDSRGRLENGGQVELRSHAVSRRTRLCRRQP